MFKRMHEMAFQSLSIENFLVEHAPRPPQRLVPSALELVSAISTS